VEKYYTTLICPKQAIQPRVVGPLFYIRCIDYTVTKLIATGFGTSIDCVNIFHEPWPVRARARKVG